MENAKMGLIYKRFFLMVKHDKNQILRFYFSLISRYNSRKIKRGIAKYHSKTKIFNQ